MERATVKQIKAAEGCDNLLLLLPAEKMIKKEPVNF
jgi:hypothetical protein